MTWEETRDAAGPGSVAILPVGAIEAHGPHLPLETDVIIAQAMARSGAARLAARPELVREATRAGLPPNPASLSRAIRDGKQSFEEAGGARAYFGFPAQATAEEGRLTIEVLGGILDEAVQAELGARTRQAT